MTGTLARAFRIAVVTGGLLLACSSSNDASPPLCVPNQIVYCRCKDFQEGQKTCDASGAKYGPCLPCETADNPGLPDPGDPISAVDASVDVSTVGSNGDGPCGDGVVNIGEACDVPGSDPANGCSATCKLSGGTPPASAACPGLDLHLWKDGQIPALDSTTIGGGTHRTQTACGTSPTTGAAGSDRVFHVYVHATGTLKVAVANATFNAFVWAATSCSDSVTALGCANASNDPGGESLAVPVTSGREYWVFVDGTGTGNNSGPFHVAFSLL